MSRGVRTFTLITGLEENMLQLNKSFYVFRIGQLISALGVRCGQIALIWWIIRETESAVLVGIILAPSMLIRTILIPLLGPIGDMVSRKHFSQAADLWNMVFSFLLFILVAENIFYTPLIIFLSIMLSIGFAAMIAIENSFVAELVTRETLQSALSLTAFINSTGLVLGAVLGGIMVGLVGIADALLFNAVSFFIAFLCTSIVKNNPRKKPISVAEHQHNALINIWKTNFISGINALIKIKLELYWSFLSMAINFFLVPFLIVIVPSYVYKVLLMPAWYLGLLEGCFAFGMLISSVALVKMANNYLGKYIVSVFGMTLVGVSILFSASINNLILLPFCFVLLGIGLMLNNLNASMQRILAIPDHYRSRIFSCAQFFIEITVPLGLILAGISIRHLGFFDTIILFGLSIISFSFMFIVLPLFSTLMKGNVEQTTDFYLKYYPHAFIEK